MMKNARAFLILVTIVCIDAEIEKNPIPINNQTNELEPIEKPQIAMLPTYTNLTHKLDNANSTQIFAAKQTIKSQLDLTMNLIEKLITKLTEDNNLKRSKRSILSFTRLDDELSLLRNEIVELKKTIEYLTNKKNKCTSIKRKQSTVIKNFGSFIKAYSKNILSDCVHDIESNNFEAANKKLMLINDDDDISFIVHKAYIDEKSNFDLLLKFGDYIKNVEKKFAIYRALASETINNPFNKIKLSENLRNFITLENVLPEIKLEAKSLVHDLINSVKNVIQDNLMHGIRNGYHNSTNTELEENIYNYDKTLFADLIKNAMYETHGEANNNNAFKYMSSFKHIRQLAEACIAIFETLERKDDLNSDFVVMLAFNIKTVMNKPDYDNLDDELRSDLELVKTKLPKSVMNAAFASKVCIKNVKHNEYIYSPENKYNFNKRRRYVIMWKPGDKVSGAYWKFEKNGNDLYIKNIAYNEYMYSPINMYSKDRKRRYVFTWIKGSRDPDARWKIEPDGDYCYLKNVKKNEYMYAPNNEFLHDNQRRYVFTWKVGIRKDGDAKWEIEEC